MQGERHPSDLPRLVGEWKPAFRIVFMLMRTWDTGRHPAISMRRKLPMQPEAVARAVVAADPCPRRNRPDSPYNQKRRRMA